MKINKKLLFVACAVLAFGLASCNSKKSSTQSESGSNSGSSQSSTNSSSSEAFVQEYPEGDENIYDYVLKDYYQLMSDAKELKDDDERYVKYAKAEAYLLDQAVFVPTTTQGGSYGITRVAPRTVPYVQWGPDEDRLGTAVVVDKFITKADRAELLDQWKKAVAGTTAKYDPETYLTGKGYTIKKELTTVSSEFADTLDGLATSYASDSETIVNFVDNLLQYNNLGQLTPCIAKSYTVSEDGKTYTFTLRDDVKWVTATGEEYAKVKADDFVAGLQHMLDAAAGLEYLVEGVIKNAKEYNLGDVTDFGEVGVKAVNDTTLQFTLCDRFNYFPTMIPYAIFQPMNRDFFVSKGGAFGKAEYAAAKADETKYQYGLTSSYSSILYCGAYTLSDYTAKAQMVYTKNPEYYNKDAVKLDKITVKYNSGEDLTGFYEAAVAGDYVSATLNSVVLPLAKNDGNFEKYAYVSDTNSTTYFGAINLNRQTYENGSIVSPKNDSQKTDTHNAFMNKNFRKAILYAFDRASQNAASRGEELKNQNLRNMYTSPNFLTLAKDVDGYKKGTTYGELVEAELRKLGNDVIKTEDGQDGWYNVEAAKACLAQAKVELGDKFVGPVQIDIMYYSSSELQSAQAAAFKKSIEEALGTENVIVNAIGTSSLDDYYNAGYRASNGAAVNYDVFYGSGWGPDYGDPATYLDTFLPDAVGYMTKTIGLW